MSSPSRSDSHAGHDAKTAHAGDAHDDHAHAFDPEPAREMAADEPRTPGWLPLLGVTLFVVGGTYFLSTSSSDAAPEVAPSATAAASVAAAPKPVAPPTTANARPPIPGNGPDRDRLRQALEQAKKAGGVPSGNATGGPATPPPNATAAPRPPRPPAPPAPPAPPLPGGAQ